MFAKLGWAGGCQMTKCVCVWGGCWVCLWPANWGAARGFGMPTQTGPVAVGCSSRGGLAVHWPSQAAPASVTRQTEAWPVALGWPTWAGPVAVHWPS